MLGMYWVNISNNWTFKSAINGVEHIQTTQPYVNPGLSQHYRRIKCFQIKKYIYKNLLKEKLKIAILDKDLYLCEFSKT